MRAIDANEAAPQPEKARSVDICAGTTGRLIRACMKFARANPGWYAVGPVETTKDGALRQRVVRKIVT